MTNTKSCSRTPGSVKLAVPKQLYSRDVDIGANFTRDSYPPITLELVPYEDS